MPQAEVIVSHHKVMVAHIKTTGPEVDVMGLYIIVPRLQHRVMYPEEMEGNNSSGGLLGKPHPNI